ncbi:MAG: holo-ACP synthase [Acidobacteriaceae bacterium]
MRLTQADIRLQSMIVGTGTDLMEIDRIRASIARYGERFLRRVYTDGEIAYCRRKKNGAENFAARFAAKEAAAKALGTGISQGVGWREIEVRREPSGRPTLHFTGRAEERAARLGVRAASISLTHSRDLAMAVVILEA